MADVTVAEFRDRFAEFDRIDDATISFLIPQAYEMSDVSREATLYCIAHLASLEGERIAKPDGGSGEVVSDALGPQSRSYMSLAESNRDVFFSTSTYGRRMLTLESRSVNAVFSSVTA